MINFECSKINVIVLAPKEWKNLRPKFYVGYKYSDHTNKIFMSFEHNFIW